MAKPPLSTLKGNSNLDEISKVILDRVSKGQIGNYKIYYDLQSQSFAIYTCENTSPPTFQFKQYAKKETVEQIIYEKLPHKVIKKLGIAYLRRSIPTVNCIFDPTRLEHKWEENGERYVNTFTCTKYLRSVIDLKKTLSLDEALEKIRVETPNIYLLLKNLFVLPERIKYFLNYLAFIIQTRQKTGTCIILKGLQGTGKNLLYEKIIKPILGKYSRIVSYDGLSSRYNDYLTSTLFLVGNEIKGTFQEGNQVYERLKALISDSVIQVEGKYQASREIVSRLAGIMIFSNEDTPIQIQPSDRRYTVFSTSTSPLNSIVKDMEDYIKQLEEEKHTFYRFLGRLIVDSTQARTALDTEEKQGIIDTTTPRLMKMGHALRTRDIEYISNAVEDYIETYYETVESDSNWKAKQKGNLQYLIDKLENKSIRIENKILIWLYRILVDSNASPRKIGLDLSKILSKSIAINGKRYRKITFTEEDNERDDEIEIERKRSRDKKAIHNFLKYYINSNGKSKARVIEVATKTQEISKEIVEEVINEEIRKRTIKEREGILFWNFPNLSNTG